MMTSTISYDFGDVVLVPFPFTDQTATKRRPAVVVSSSRYHREHRDLILIAVTSQSRPAAVVGEAALAQWRAAGLLKPSVIKPVLTTIDQILVLRKLGRLHAQDLQTLRDSLRDIIGT
jgi:mRNA interferase MazF